MANATRNVTFSKTAYVKKSTPNTVYPTSPSSQYLISAGTDGSYDYNIMYFGGPSSWPSSLKRAKIVKVRFRMYVKPGETSAWVNSINGNFDPTTITYNNGPADAGDNYVHFYFDAGDAGASQGSWSNIWITAGASDSATEKSELAAGFLRAGGFQIDDTINHFYENDKWYIKPALSNGDKTYMEITYDDAVTIKPKVTVTSDFGSVNPFAAASIQWKLEKNSSYCCYNEVWTQSSAVLYWRVSGESSWNTVNVSGSTMKATIAKNTLPEGSTIQYYLSVTDTDGNVSTYGTASSPKTFTTMSSSVSAASYPSGNAVDSRTAKTFSWTLACGGTTVTQSSATLYWRVSGASSWNSIAVSGNTKSKSVAGYTFPAGSTIQWYISATDNMGHTSSTSTGSFTTVAAAVTPTAYPSGSNINTAAAISFSWSISGNSGEFTQRSAVFYWKVSTASSWNSISISNSTKSISVPGNTFPSGSTIQWYVQATESGGASASCSTKTFNSVSTKITAVSYPSGNKVDYAAGLRFTWKFTSNAGDYGQQSAILYWRASTSDNWTPINISGNTQEVTVPAGTFPASSTIQWYLYGVDSTGVSSQTSSMSFSTASTQIDITAGPTSGYKDPRQGITFSWVFTTGESVLPEGSATFYWRQSGGSSWTSVSDSGNDGTVTIANIPVAADIEWYVSGTDSGGNQATSATYTFSTTAPLITPIPKEPVGRAEDGSSDIILRWSFSSTDGATPSREILSWKLPSESQTSWHTLLDSTNAETSYTVPAGTFQSGPVQWKLICYNIDNLPGEERIASFVVVAAPAAPQGVTASEVPITTISWQDDGKQQAYEISIDGESVKKGFGADVKQWTVKEPLPDGLHTVGVRVQGAYGLWSEESTAVINVVNEPTGTIEAGGIFGDLARIYWETDGTGDPETIAVYRDGKFIGIVTEGTVFEDRLCIGPHVWRVEYWYQDGNYDRSNDVSGIVRTATAFLETAAGDRRVDLRLSENREPRREIESSQTAVSRHVTGAVFPVTETAPYETVRGSFDCAFLHADEAVSFEQLKGKRVILKTPGGIMINGVLTGFRKRITTFYTAYTFSLAETEWEDFTIYDEIG